MRLPDCERDLHVQQSGGETGVKILENQAIMPEENTKMARCKESIKHIRRLGTASLADTVPSMSV